MTKESQCCSRWDRKVFLMSCYCLTVSVLAPCVALAFQSPIIGIQPQLLFYPHGRRKTLSLLQSTATPKQDKIEGESTFWVSVRARGPPKTMKAPYYPNLDQDGMLPDACYNQLNENASVEPKPNCLVAIDLKESTLDDNVLSFMHQCIDSGFTTFHGGTAPSYRALKLDTPRSVLNRCNFVTSVTVPTEMPLGGAREVLLRPLHDMGSDCMDTLQLRWNSKSPYLLDMLDTAQELQREGLIRSIVGHRLPPTALRDAHGCDFPMESNQIFVNLLEPVVQYHSEMLLAANDTNTKLVADTPLVGGLLSEAHYNQPGEPYKFQLTMSERQHVESLHRWSKRFRHAHRWTGFQTDMVNVLHHIARKHRVSMETVALRWVLELEHISSAVVACNMKRQEEIVYKQPSQLRHVFRLELDQEDEERLWAATGCEKPSMMIPNELDYENLEEGDNGLFLPRQLFF